MVQTKQHYYLKRITFSALLVALSILFSSYGKMFQSIGWRLSFENLPVLLGAVALGPVYGMLIALCSDVLSCLLIGGYAPNPILTLGIMSVGLTAGLLYKFLFEKRKGVTPLTLLASVVPAHIVGSMLIKSYGLYLMGIVPDVRYVLAVRVPNYIIVSLAEWLLLTAIYKNRFLKKKLDSLNKK